MKLTNFLLWALCVVSLWLIVVAAGNTRPTAQYAQPGCASVVDLSWAGLSVTPDCTAARLATQRYTAEQVEQTRRTIVTEQEQTARARIVWPMIAATVLGCAAALVVVAYVLRPRPAQPAPPHNILVIAAPYLAQGWTLDTHPDTGHWIVKDDAEQKYIDVQTTALARRT
mgnify:CR=1 FL=1